jgi:glycosyltransferase involved in cell wall biosynthesis
VASDSPSGEPLVSVLVAAHDAEATIELAVHSVLDQTLGDLELIVVDDCSADRTAERLSAVDDPRLVVIRNDENRGLAASLDTALDCARGRYVARLDADDVALADRLERQVAALAARPGLALVGSAVLEIDERGVPGSRHAAPRGRAGVRWHALFGAPFFHPTVLVDRDVLVRHDLRYDPSFEESEDYDLWTRLLRVADGDNLGEVLTLRRVHRGQASKRRGALQRRLQLEVARGAIAEVAPELTRDEAELAWRVGSGDVVVAQSDEAVAAFLRLVEAFGRRHGSRARRAIAPVAARRLARVGAAGAALRLDPLLVPRLARDRLRARRLRRADTAAAHASLAGLAAASGSPLRVVLVSPEPTPYRSPLLDLVAERPEVDLTVAYAARTVASRGWSVEPGHRAIFLRGVRLRGLRRLLRHDYALTPGIWRVLGAARPDVLVATGWSTFPSQAAIAWARRRRVPYLLLVSSHDDDPRPGWRRAAKRLVVPRLVRGAAGALVLGTRSRDSLVARGARPERIRVFANTVDVAAWGARADGLAGRRDELREALGAAPEDVVVLSVARLAREKGVSDLVRAVALGGAPAPLLVVAGSGPERERLVDEARTLGVRLVLLGDVPWERLHEVYAAADVFALLSTSEPWGVVVNEAMASGLPIVLSTAVGAEPDLLEEGGNGFAVAPGDAAAAGDALARLASDPGLRETMGRRSRELVQRFDYASSVEAFVTAVREAAVR